MQIPAAMFIESAVDMILKERAQNFEDYLKKTKELEEAVGAKATIDFTAGYLLGLKTVDALLITQGKEPVTTDMEPPVVS